MLSNVKSRAGLAAILIGCLTSGASLAAQQAAPADMPAAGGPKGTSDGQRYDAVGYAGVAADVGSGVTAAHASLPAGSIVEVTALDSGRTVLMLVKGAPVADLITLSPAAAKDLGASGARTAVRVRLVVPTPQDQSALMAGREASPRIDAPPVLLTGLRKRLPATSQPASPPLATSPAAAVHPKALAKPSTKLASTAIPKAAPTAPPKPAPRATPTPAAKPSPKMATVTSGGKFTVQVAALSSAPGAQALAKKLGAHVEPSGRFHRVLLGPFADAASAKRARDDAAKRGYGDARIVPVK